MKPLSLLVALAATSSTPAPAGDAHLNKQIPMQGDPGYVSEHCLSLQAGERLSYIIQSPHPVDFNIRYHDEEDALYPIRVNHVTSYEGQVRARVNGDYCFMWINNERQQAGYDIRLVLKRETTG